MTGPIHRLCTSYLHALPSPRATRRKWDPRSSMHACRAHCRRIGLDMFLSKGPLSALLQNPRTYVTKWPYHERDHERVYAASYYNISLLIIASPGQTAVSLRTHQYHIQPRIPQSLVSRMRSGRTIVAQSDRGCGDNQYQGISREALRLNAASVHSSHDFAQSPIC